MADVPTNLTPMMKQYMQVKSTAPADSILMYRMGDFYEMFFEDAKKASPVLEVALTARAGSPMCGIPYHALELYLPKLLEAGFKVAIAEQQEDPALAKGIVKRGISRIVTPGSILEGPLLAPSRGWMSVQGNSWRENMIPSGLSPMNWQNSNPENV